MARKKSVWGVLLRLVILCAAGGVLCAALLGGYLALARRAPLTLPPPTGPYAVGRVCDDWADASRSDPLADQANTPRELAIWVWYPSQAPAGPEPAPYLPPSWATA